MNLLVVLIPLVLFLLMQAIFWFVTSKKSAHDAFIAERLGTDESITQSQALMRQGAQGAFAQQIVDMLEAAGEDSDITPFFTRMLVLFFATFAITLVMTSEPAAATLFGVCAAFLPFAGLARKRRVRMRRIEEQLPEALEVMIISLRAGQSLDQTIRLTASELDAPIGEEFRRVSEEQGLGRPIDEALVSMSQRLDTCRTVRAFVVSVMVLHQTGGNLVEVLESIIDSMRQQSQYERKLAAMTAEGRTSARILAAIPPLFAFFSYLANPDYIGGMFTDGAGQAMLFVAMSLYITGVLWTRRLTRAQT